MVDSGLLDVRTLTSWPSLQVDLQNAGATWVDEQVHVDHAFNEQFQRVLAAESA